MQTRIATCVHLACNSQAIACFAGTCTASVIGVPGARLIRDWIYTDLMVFYVRWLWPEGQVLLFNTVDNRSSEWGEMPIYW